MELLTIMLLKLGLLSNIMDKQIMLFIMKVMLIQILQLFREFGDLIKEDKMANLKFNTNDCITWIVYHFIILYKYIKIKMLFYDPAIS